MSTQGAISLFAKLEKLCRGRPARLIDLIEQVREWMGRDRSSRPSGYMNSPKFFSGYCAYHLPLHLPELFWIFEQHSQQIKKFPETIRDLGCGPGTLSLSYLLWCEKHGHPFPKKIELADYSKRALTTAKELILSISPKTEVFMSDENIFHRHTSSSKRKVDFIFLGHVLNELGNGPRYRDKKLELVERIKNEQLNPQGQMLIIEPPLREPTLDLMALRDALTENQLLKVVAPCPRGLERCHMAERHLGWCYAQPPRSWARDAGIAPWDLELESALEIRLDHPGFSYLLLNNDLETDSDTHKVSLTDFKAPQKWNCTTAGIKLSNKSLYRGAIRKLVDANSDSDLDTDS